MSGSQVGTRSIIPLITLLLTEIDCTGEVTISEHENFDEWGIDILVKFRYIIIFVE